MQFRKFSSEFRVFLSNFKSFGEKSSLHGLQYIFSSRLNIFERLLWLVLIIFSSYAAYDISAQQHERYVANPTVISLERDYRDWNGTLPAITICYKRRVDDDKAKSFIERVWKVRESDEELTYFLEFVRAVVYLNQSIEKYSKDRRFDDLDMLEMVKDVHPKMNSIVTSFNSTTRFVLHQVITERGICYTVNSILWPLIGTNPNKKDKVDLSIKPLSCEFLKNQCYMKLDVYDPTISFALHSPFEIPADTTQFLDIGVTDEIEGSYNMLETAASDQLKKLRISQRKCYFTDESNSHLPVYSFNLCKLICRAKSALKFCGCRPYFYPFINGTICSILGHMCLVKNDWPAAAVCECSKTCVEIVYTQNSLKKINW